MGMALKTKICLRVDALTWEKFKQKCFEKKLKFSHQFDGFMQAFLDAEERK
jgi:hypothetical protein